MTLRDRFLLVPCLLASLPGFAAPPLQTDDAGVLGPADCELEAQAARERAGNERTLASGLQVACGVGIHTQLALSAARARTAGVHADVVAVSGKHGLWESAPEGEEGSALALSWQVAQVRATGGRWQSLGNEVRVIGTQPLDSAWTLHVNLGHAHDVQAGSHSTLWGSALEHGPVKTLGGAQPMAEVYGDDHGPARWNLGLRYAAIEERLFLNASYGQPLNRGSQSLLTLGGKLAF